MSNTTRRQSDWRNAAVCLPEDPELFFPIGTQPGAKDQEREAQAVCQRCPSLEACGQWALETRQQFGVWGGLTEKDRSRILRQRGLEPTPVPKPRTFLSIWNDRHQPLEDGHIGWTGAIPVHISGGYHTPQQIAFRLDRGRPPCGIVRRTCDREGCVHPGHLRDQQERDTARQAAVRAKAAV